jgi:CubicO group peptidase (beta-lactamase class C family)
MRRAIYGLIVLGYSLAAHAGSARSQVEAVLAEYEARGLLSGTVLVSQGGWTLNRGYGKANDATAEPNSPDTRFLIASITKSFVSACLLRLEQLGKLSTRDPIDRWLPEYPHPIPLTAVMSHTGGVPEEAYDHPAMASKLYKEPITYADMITALKDLPVDFQPGADWRYSNIGYRLLGEVIRRASGTTFTDYANRELLEPQGLSRTTVGLPAAGAPLAQPYVLQPEGGRLSFLELNDVHELHVNDDDTDGNIYTTTADLARWVERLSAGDVLGAEATARMFTPVLNDYGYGWFIRRDAQGRRFYIHSGGWIGYVSWAIRYPDDDLTVIILTNQEMPAKDASELRERVVAAALSGG